MWCIVYIRPRQMHVCILQPLVVLSTGAVYLVSSLQSWYGRTHTLEQSQVTNIQNENVY